MSLFVIADLHLSLSVDKPMDIFGGWDNYVNRLEESWQCKVKPEDTVVIPGDFSWAMKLQDALEDFKFLDRLNGKKILSKGNHDYWWSSLQKMTKFFVDNNINSISFLHNNCYQYGNYGICGTRGWISENGETEDKKVLLREAMRLETSITDAEKQGLKPLVFLHYPPIYLSGINEEIMSVLRQHNIKECFYGHIHGKKGHACAFKGNYDGINYHLISSDYLQFVPLDITKFVQSDE
ncbi:MAG: metallophosphoesterase [Ruminococcus sp.]|nr:metallophosphoesterase [Ruminococcus sp.]